MEKGALGLTLGFHFGESIYVHCRGKENDTKMLEDTLKKQSNKKFEY